MPFLLAILGGIIAIAVFMIRARNAANAAGDLIDMAQDVAGAARRFGFRRRANTHPMDSIDDPNIGVATIASAFMELNDLPTQDQRQALHAAMQDRLGVSAADAEELLILGKWLQGECGGADAAITRACRRTARMAGTEKAVPLLQILQAAAHAAPNGLSDQQRDALDDVKRVFRL